MERLLKKITDRTAHVAVIGLGYVGLPLAVGFAKAGYHVTSRIAPRTSRSSGWATSAYRWPWGLPRQVIT